MKKISPWGPEISQDKEWRPLTFVKAATKRVELRSCLRLCPKGGPGPGGCPGERGARGVPSHSPSLKKKGPRTPSRGPAKPGPE
ncbi:hypothetical protein NDU88_002836 [Pleurodeles waltl]|uniref:Uncharacterized protein n=1 Tax=Pleurodeles waltl TaxID=8319 RepID=A0AAV7VFI0_PLEWA|nr:hypothetical protein NDU88_002836 [Pleurodeles waltl]